MAKFSRIDVVSKMKTTVIVPVFYNGDIETTLTIIDTAYKAGIRVFEFTNRGEQADQIFSQLIKVVRKNYPELALGIGSIVDEITAGIFIQNGADFIVSPLFNPAIAKICNRRKIAWFPGCTTVSEISNAHECGAEVVKIFPANSFDAKSFIKGVKAPMPWTEVMPTGGVSPTVENIKSWLDVGVSCVGIGDKLIVKNDDSTYDLEATYVRLKSLMEFVSDYRGMTLGITV
ncbi:bifunctional 4-hydroxy-2-oxoglutarate aldolase/2-dehydro-3-deoxy-phosphogluconate aldolase [Flammeovirga agarivorans]|uniref:Bifunctional 4-hydroxy-2-oxoglutarate aldolase/2-dehydro-3-deoxy-phosphogluconate aldolase n=1 Tax=Flammeovirga agarivorans TaxID=2726742 RepID=A0A7X8XXK8_9BACT|nr:bifunctional 4-hydroxy-2-oxoglutarate aldolase/2-dehydro-3-deoxy-phosphogluconate aldolase [Flammeovirga agarivorans]NLR93332.1 bifunctional 4-hydroxy-2-oxoglutarate aldolase/2-dehydro-3-deoxy-phosphogluconate aldolase [Flammeovirga agarivorans]